MHSIFVAKWMVSMLKLSEISMIEVAIARPILGTESLQHVFQVSMYLR